MMRGLGRKKGSMWDSGIARTGIEEVAGLEKLASRNRWWEME